MAGVPVVADGVGVLEVLDIEIGVVCLGAVESLLLVAGRSEEHTSNSSHVP